MTTMKSEWAERDFYQDLGVDPTASAQEITSAYRGLARQLHPDAGTGDPQGEERFRDVALAYEVLSRDDTRRSYDEARLGRSESRSGHPRPDHRTARPRGAGPTRGFGRDDESAEGAAVLRLALADAVFGTTATVAVPGGETLRVRVPPGVRDGQHVRLAGRGPVPGSNSLDGRSLVVRVSAHPYFARKGDDLLLSLPVTFPELALGADIDVPTLDGQLIAVRVPAGTPSGRTFRLRGLGAPTAAAGRGDLVVTFEVAVSRELSNRERRAIQGLAKATPSPRVALMDSTVKATAEAKPNQGGIDRQA